jgi:sterol O-acyltransferase
MATEDSRPELESSKTDLTSLTDRTSAMSHALEGLSTKPPEDSWTPETSSGTSDVDGTNELKPRTTAILSEDSSSETQPIKQHESRRKSIQVVLEQSGKKGEYIFTAKDPVFQEVLQSGLQREAEKRNGKSYKKPQNLVFTQQFTTFDRQNASAAQSPFHGFFTLFWIAMALLLGRIAALNYRAKGSIFGNAEVLHLMVDRDLFVMLTTDVAMCVATSFGFFLQKAIAKGYLTWNGSGWLVQSLWQIFYTCTIIWVTFWREWPFSHTVFIVLHCFVVSHLRTLYQTQTDMTQLLMKQHAYTFYNGYCMSNHN